MTPNLNAARTSVESPIETPTARHPSLPLWWRADRRRFDKLTNIRLHIYAREKAIAKKAQSVMTAGLIAAVSIYSVDATGAVAIPATASFVAVLAALVLPIVVAWLLEHRLVQQLGDIKLRSELWLELLDAVKCGAIDVAQLEFAGKGENEIEAFLRKEGLVAARFLASSDTLVPHLPIFGYCFTLKNS